MKKPKGLLLAVLLCVLVRSAEATEVGRVLIEAEGGGMLQNSLEQLVHATIRTREGSEFSAAVLSDDIAQLIKSGSFDDVQTRIEDLDDGRYLVKFEMKTKKIVTSFGLEGNVKLNEKKLRRLLTHKTNVILNERTLSADRIAIIDKYKSNGYYGVEVRSVIKPNEDGKTVSVVHVITETDRAKLQGTDFVGNTVFEASELRDVLATRREWWRYIFRFGGYFNDQLLPMDKAHLKELYMSRGYLDFAVEKIEYRYDDEHKWVTPVYHLYEGQPYTVSSISLVGAQRFTAEQLLSKTALKEGQVFNSLVENADLNRMKAQYEILGYLDLSFTSEYVLDRSNHRVDIKYKVVEGKPSRVRDIQIVGNQITQDRVIRREMAILPGDLGDEGKLRLSKQRISNMGFFENVEVYPVVTPKDDERDIRVEVQEKNTGSISLGAGYSTEDSIVGFMELQERNFDLGRLFNWPPKGAGQNFRSYIGLGSETTNLGVSLIEPALFDSDFELATDLFYNTRYEDEYDERHIGGKVMLSLPIAFEIPGFEHTEYWNLGFGMKFDNVRISGISHEERSITDYDEAYMDDEIADYRVEDDKGSYWDNGLVLSLTRDTRDNYRFPSRGSRIVADVDFINEAMGSYSTYAKLHLGGVAYIPVVRDYVLKLGLDVHSAEHISGDDVRIFDRYFAGGVGTIRGFKRHDVSPANSNDNTIGGCSMLTGTVELIKPVKKFAYVSLFTDAGNVWWDSIGHDLDKLNLSVGIGLQFTVLPIRLDYGYPVHTEGEHLDGKHGRLHFNVMYSF